MAKLRLLQRASQLFHALWEADFVVCVQRLQEAGFSTFLAEIPAEIQQILRQHPALLLTGHV